MHNSSNPFLKRAFVFSFFFCVVSCIGQRETLASSKESHENPIPFSAFMLPPASGQKPSSIVVLFHGYGDNGEKFLSLGRAMAQCLPETLFVSLNGPTLCPSTSSGRQWLSPSKNNPTSKLLYEANMLTPSLNRYVDDLLKVYNIPPEKVAFLGFSQGARIALHIGLRRPKSAGIVAISGPYLNDPLAANLSHPPILLMHGTEDQRVPVFLAQESYEQLKGLNMSIKLTLLPGVEHNIDPQGLAIAGKFLKDAFYGKGSSAP